MKRIEFIAPVESMRGNLSGSQNLVYRENNNPAYEAPDGDAHALNYQPRFVGAKVSKNGLKYFAVRTKSTTKLTNKSRMAMAVLGVTAAWKSALKTGHAVDWAKLESMYVYAKEHGISVESTFNKWIANIMGQMLRYKVASRTLTQASISVTLENPYSDSKTAPVINQKTFLKFYDLLQCDISDTKMSIDGKSFNVTIGCSWEDLKSQDATMNPNLRASYANISIPSAGANPLYNGLPIYTLEGVVVTGESTFAGHDAYTTIAPSA